ncbi:SpoIIE family protein phosphatase [Nannocystis bainbridge]|uniref:SpoIIE family protein phosphatase n=1 Tax=Nannocystis bainbridge TaxID=2995303 RepID=A0ABT5E425_9BACT|nr:SpoIIE family protein phosphatase [Nannocystis bainbridge]MDC0720626.1 SpoIIE family protein phosphatase [Nannocystis bainbridge]
MVSDSLVHPRRPLALACALEGAQDRAGVFPLASGATLVVADGAGGSGGGAAAAEAVIAAVAASLRLPDGTGWAELLLRVDRELPLGEATAVVLRVDGERIFGASVGDSGALLFDAAGRCVDLTAGQPRKPLLGSRCASPVAFSGSLGDATLLLATDGLLKYARLEAIAEVVTGQDLAAIPARLLDLVRLRSGALPDDVAIVVARRVAG